MTQKIVGNFVVGAVYCSNDIGQWTGHYLVRHYGVNNGRVVAVTAVPGTFETCALASEKAMELGAEFAKNLDPGIPPTSPPGSGDELFIPPSASGQRAEATDMGSQK